MEKDKLFLAVDTTTMMPTWNFHSNFGIEIQSNELNCGSEQLPNCFFNLNWDNSMDQSDPFESALSSMVSSPVASNGKNSTNTSCYSTPLNSPPRLNLSMMDPQMRGNFTFPGNHLPSHPSVFSRNFGGFYDQFGLNESELPQSLIPRMESGKFSRFSSDQSIKVAGFPMGVLENNDGFSPDGKSNPDEKFSGFSGDLAVENTEFGDCREESLVSEQIPGEEIGVKGQSDANGRKRKSIPREKGKEAPSFSPPKDAKVATESDEPNSKRTKPNEANGNGKAKAEENKNGKIRGNGNRKKTQESENPPEPPKDYIHVRARRGQATDSHSLAERVRREKIGERMKFLQDLVPGCNKVIGKAVMLDEIINYVQSLQRQVEFLSMKLTTVNPSTDFNMEALLSKSMFQSRESPLHNIYSLGTKSIGFPYGYQSLESVIPTGTENFLLNSLKPKHGAPSQ